MKKTLHTIYLKLDTSSKSLTKIALQQLILKIMFSVNKKIDIIELSKELKSTLNTEIDKHRIQDALGELQKDKKIFKQSNSYKLNPACFSMLEKAYQSHETKSKNVLNRYFSNTTSKPDDIHNWFEDVTIQFFEDYYYEWIDEISRTGKKKADYKDNLDSIIKKCFKKNNINVHDRDWLSKQYFRFIKSTDSEDNALLWDYGTSLFSATLITSSISVDQLTIDLFSNSKFVLDTNILIDIALYEKEVNASFKAIEKVFSGLNIKPGYFPISREEYKRKIDSQRKETLFILNNYPFEVVKEIDDCFIEEALSRGCLKNEDFERFFDQIIYIPDLFSDSLELKLFDHPELDHAIRKAQEDQDIVKKLNAIYKNKTKKDKRNPALIHDAGLVGGAQFIRDNAEKCWILTKDGTLNEYAIENTIRDDYPIAIGIDTLVNILAINNGGTDIDPNDFAPLFAKYIKLSFIPDNDTFKIEDLSRMLDAHVQISEMPPSSVIEIAKKLNKNRISGMSDDKIALELSRDFQKEKLQLHSEFESTKKELILQKEEKEKIIEKTNKAIDLLKQIMISNRVKDYCSKIFLNRILFFIILPLTTIITAFSILHINNSKLPDNWKSHLISLAINIIFWMVTNLFLIRPRIRKRYCEKVNEIKNDVENDLNMRLN